jgi:hypothetical protein
MRFHIVETPQENSKSNYVTISHPSSKENATYDLHIRLKKMCHTHAIVDESSHKFNLCNPITVNEWKFVHRLE